MQSFVAKESGEGLEELVGEPGFDHATWGDRMPLLAGVLFVAALALWLVQRSSAGKGLVVVAGLVAAVVALVNLYWIVQVGHSGAESVWKGEVSCRGQLARRAIVTKVRGRPGGLSRRCAVRRAAPLTVVAERARWDAPSPQSRGVLSR